MKRDAALDFDFAKVTEKSRDNPVFYVQYAHARICSVERNAAAMNGLAEPATAESLGRLMDADEVALIRMMAGWPRTLEAAAEAHEPHRLAFALYDLASAFHGLWNRGNDDPKMRFLREDDLELSALVKEYLEQQGFAVTVEGRGDQAGGRRPAGGGGSGVPHGPRPARRPR